MMKYCLRFILLLLISTSTFAAQEQITSFNSDITIQTDATVNIKETIVVVAQGNIIKRGLVREIPTLYWDRIGRKVDLNFKLLSVTQDGNQAEYSVKKKSNGVAIYIGSANKYLSPGEYTYVIRYSVKNAIGYFAKYDELYWNITGNGWRFPIVRASTNISVEKNQNFTQYAAYTGVTGARNKNYTAQVDGSTLTVTTTAAIQPGEGFTVAAAWPKGIVFQPSAFENLSDDFFQNTGLYLIALILLIQLAYFLYSWWHVGRERPKGTIVPVFAPPHDLSPAAIRFLKKLRYGTTVFSAAIINMAVKGYLKIHQSSKTEISLLQQNDDMSQLSIGEKAIAKTLFAKDKIFFMTQKNQKKIKESRKAHQNKLDSEFNKTYFITNSVYLVPGYGLSLLALFTFAFETWGGSQDPQLFMFTLAANIILFSIFPGLLELKKLTQFAGVCAVFIFLMYLGILPLLLTASIALNVLFHQLLKAHTLKGRKVMDQVDGFALYLEKAEKYRLQQNKPEDKNIELFEKFLPYAIALDVEQAWTTYFGNIIEKAMQDDNTNMSWYSSYNHTFSTPTSTIVNQLSTNFTAAIAAASIAPGTSSGSSGGGFSGGGGGGGGGGGW